MKKPLIFLVGLAISGVCLYFALRGLSFREIGDALLRADPRWILMAVLFFIAGYGFRTLRWNRLLLSSKDIPYSLLWKPLGIGFFANNVLPFRMGELVRAQLGGQLFGLSRMTTLASIFLERLLDMASLLLAFQAATLLFTFPDSIRRGSQIGSLLMVIGMAVLWGFVRHRARCEEWVLQILPRWGEKLNVRIAQVSSGIAILKSASGLSVAVALSICVWICEGTFLFCVMKAFDLPLPYASAYFLLFFMGLSVALPQAPGYVGTIEFFGTMALGLLGIPREQGLPVMLAIHGLQFLLIAIIGMTALSLGGMSFRKLSSISQNT